MAGIEDAIRNYQKRGAGLPSLQLSPELLKALQVPDNKGLGVFERLIGGYDKASKQNAENLQGLGFQRYDGALGSNEAETPQDSIFPTLGEGILNIPSAFAQVYSPVKSLLEAPFIAGKDYLSDKSVKEKGRQSLGQDILRQLSGEDRRQQGQLANKTSSTMGQGSGEYLDTRGQINETIENNKSTADASNTMVEGAFLENDEKLGNAVEGADNPSKQATVGALSEFLAQARPGIKPQTYGEYIKEFGDVTGLDVSGDPDNKVALMSFGLALMQNRAGKDFNVSKILSAVGEAGEAAMPDFRKAITEAKTVRAKAGEYALGKTEKDKASAMNRKNYYIVPKGTGGIKGIASNFDKGQFSMLNSYELNNLVEDPKFNEQYEIVPNATYEKVLAATMKTPEWGEKYLAKYEDIALFNGAGDDFKIPVQRLNGNYKGPDKPKQGFFNAEKYDDYYGRFKRMDTGLNKVSDQLGKAFKISSDGKLNFGGQVTDDIKGFAQAFGINDGGEATPAAEVEYILNSIAAKNAPKILGEAGKTISDNDRIRVELIIGKMKKTGSPAALRLALQEVYELIVVEGKRDVRQGLSTLNRYSGRKDPNFEKKSLSSEVNEQGVYQVSDQ